MQPAPTYLDNLEKVLLSIAIPANADCKRLEGSFAIVRLFQEGGSFASSNSGESLVDRRSTDCASSTYQSTVSSGIRSPAEWEVTWPRDAPMEKASVAKSRGAVWNGVSNTPSTGANKMSQKMRANCVRVKLVLARAVDAASARARLPRTIIVKTPFSEWKLCGESSQLRG